MLVASKFTFPVSRAEKFQLSRRPTSNDFQVSIILCKFVNSYVAGHLFYLFIFYASYVAGHLFYYLYFILVLN